jgi:hypothetical protein
MAAYYCVDEQCENEERIEDKAVCPVCGAPSQQVSFLHVEELIFKKRTMRKLNDKILFALGLDVDALNQILNDLLTELARLESLPHPKNNESEILIVLEKIRCLQNQIMVQSQLAFVKAVGRLLGL